MDLRDSFLRYRDLGDAAALARVFDATAPTLYRVAGYLARSAPDAEDLVQSTFVTAIERASTFDAERPLLPWLTGILAGHARNAARRRATDRIDPDREIAGADAVVDQVVARERRAAVATALDELSERDREVLIPYLDDARPREIAGQVRRSAGAVRVQIHRALRMLRARLPQGLIGALPSAGVPQGLSAVRREVLRHAGVSNAWSIGGAIVIKKVAAVVAMVSLLAIVLVLRDSGSRPSLRLPDRPGGDPSKSASVAPDAGVEHDRPGDGDEPRLVRADALERRDGSSRDESDGVHFTGRVVDAATGRPVAGAAVWLGEGTEYPPETAARTGADGRFERIQQKPAYQVLVLSDRYAMLRHDVTVPDLNVRTRDGYEVLTRDGYDCGDLRLLPGATVRGQVVDADGSPVADAELRLRERMINPVFLPAYSRVVGRSASDGRFALSHVPPSAYGGTGLFAVSPLGVGSTEFDVLADQRAVNVGELRLKAPWRLAVSVVDTDSRPVAGANVSAIPIRPPFTLMDWTSPVNAGERYGRRALRIGSSPSLRALFNAVTDDDGLAVLESLPSPMAFTIRVEREGFVEEHVDLVRVDERGELRREVVLQAERAWRVHGRVVPADGRSMGPVRVLLRGAHETDAEIVTDEDGRFSLPPQPGGARLELIAIADGYARKAEEVIVPVDRDLAVEWTIEPSAPLRGVLVDQDGRGVAGASVSLIRGDDRVVPTELTTPDSGEFVFPDATAGAYALVAWLPEPGWQWSRGMVQTDVAGGDDAVRIEVVRHERGRSRMIAAVVDAHTGLPLAPKEAMLGPLVEGTRPEARSVAGRMTGRVEQDGLRPGRWRLTVSVDGYLDGEVDFDVGPIAPTVDVRVELRRPGMVRGTVDLGGEARPAGLTVRQVIGDEVENPSVFTMNSMRRRTSVDNELRFAFTDVPSGRADFVLNGGELIGEAVADVRGGEETEVRIVARRRGLVQINGADAWTGGALQLVVTSQDMGSVERAWWIANPLLPASPPAVVGVSPGALRFQFRTRDEPGSAWTVVSEGVVTVVAGETTSIEVPEAPPTRSGGP